MVGKRGREMNRKQWDALGYIFGIFGQLWLICFFWIATESLSYPYESITFTMIGIIAFYSWTLFSMLAIACFICGWLEKE